MTYILTIGATKFVITIICAHSAPKWVILGGETNSLVCDFALAMASRGAAWVHVGNTDTKGMGETIALGVYNRTLLKSAYFLTSYSQYLTCARIEMEPTL